MGLILLIGSILCISSFNLLFGFAQQNGVSTLKCTFVNYVACVLIAGSIFGVQAVSSDGPAISKPNVLYLAVCAGICYGVTFLLQQYSVPKNGPSPTTMFNRLSMMVSLVPAVLYFKETISLTRWIGIILAVIALIVYNNQKDTKIDFLLIGLMFACSGSQIFNKFFVTFGDPSDQPLYTAIAFFMAMNCTALAMKKDKVEFKFNKNDLIYGIILGIADVSASFLQVRSLLYLPTTVVYPSTAAAVILVTVVIARIKLKENLSKRSMAAMVITMASLILLNL